MPYCVKNMLYGKMVHKIVSCGHNFNFISIYRYLLLYNVAPMISLPSFTKVLVHPRALLI